MRHEVCKVPDHLTNEKFLLQFIKYWKILQQCLYLQCTLQESVIFCVKVSHRRKEKRKSACAFLAIMAIDRLGIRIHLGSLFLVFLRSKLRELCKGYSKDCRKQQTKVPVIPSAQNFCDKPIRARSLRGKILESKSRLCLVLHLNGREYKMYNILNQ